MYVSTAPTINHTLNPITVIAGKLPPGHFRHHNPSHEPQTIQEAQLSQRCRVMLCIITVNHIAVTALLTMSSLCCW